MSDSLKSIEALIGRARSLLLDKAYDTPATRNNLRLLEEQRQNILDGKRIRNVDGVYVTSKIVNEERVIVSAGGFSPDDRVVSLAMTVEQSLVNLENSIAKGSSTAKKNQALSKEQRILNTEKRYAEAIEHIKKELGNMGQMTHEAFELKFHAIKPKPNIPLPKAKKLIQSSITLLKARRSKS